MKNEPKRVQKFSAKRLASMRVTAGHTDNHTDHTVAVLPTQEQRREGGRVKDTVNRRWGEMGPWTQTKEQPS